MEIQPWWRGAVIYQIYPRSFMDANNDGIGDLAGIVEKFPYIRSLGVDAVWISPFFKSPMKDFGYDISSYREIDPMFGNMDDFDRLMNKAKEYDIKVVIDQVLSHTSDQHPWFIESRQNKTNAKADWYVWADAKEDGTPPNNWLSIFGGCAWQWEPRRQQYYLHNFLTSQPDLNFHHPEVQKAVLENVEFWLKRGVDGFRLDAINFCFHDQQLRDNPAKAPKDRKGRGFSEDNPYAFQYHYYNNTQPENIAFMEDIRQLMDKYPNVVALGEISSEDSLQTMADYTQGNKRLHMAYSFELLTPDGSPSYIRQTVEALEDKLVDGWPCWAIGNHDVMRVASRWGNENNRQAQSKMFNALLASLRGSVCSYQGEELGLTEADIAYDDLQDPYGITFWPTFKGRDGCRTPMPWSAQESNAGFSQSDYLWLPVSDAHQINAVSVQQNQPSSVLNAYQTFLSWRKSQSPLLYGDINFLESSDDKLVFTRQYQGNTLYVLANFSDTTVVFDLPNSAYQLVEGHGFLIADVSTNEQHTTVTVAPYQIAYLAQ
ncbi:alpha-glucosidase family protein [Thalassotalea sp. 1_MG-2023]|uniref:alpha-glucosidase family protein n=1 Tax=Thalassotalea sp. 1_MG-2023 TaxID=3062680 RepID=UPI0026E4688A|nr:alpha-glucosidase family protein [Thalassotalea sp. 1_MG-2023]MDO6427126.1 alpha-glucosidase family protein [Thalassotalea sp. 1_MG-2023]